MTDFEIVRQALENPSCEEVAEGPYLTYRLHEAGEALAALTRIEEALDKVAILR